MSPLDPPLDPPAPPPAGDEHARLGGLARVLEIKRTLAGTEKRFECGRLLEDGPHLVVLFVAMAEMHVHGVTLPARTITFGHFWRDRGYNVYHWLDGVTGQNLGAYVNLSAETRFQDDRLEWLDLTVDVLVLPGQAPRVLDEDEIPADAPPDLLARIAAARQEVLEGLPRLLDELEQFRARLWLTLRRPPGEAP